MTYPHQPGARDRHTSIAAANAIADKAPNLRAATLIAYKTADGLTADEAADVLGLSYFSIRPRVTELARMGELEDSGEVRPNHSGKNAIVWRLKWKHDLFN